MGCCLQDAGPSRTQPGRALPGVAGPRHAAQPSAETERLQPPSALLAQRRGRAADGPFAVAKPRGLDAE
eukprot:916182-Pyramimonas_sp.AAC.1